MVMKDYWVKALKLSNGAWGWRVCTGPDWVNECVAMSNPEHLMRTEDQAVRAGVGYANFWGTYKGTL